MHRRMVGVAVAAGLALVACLLPGAAAPAAAIEWPLPGTPPAATFLHMVSAPTDHVGDGRTWTFVPAEADITVTAQGGDVDVHIEGDTWWDVLLRPTSPQQAVTEGRHEGTARAVVSGDGRGCGDAHTRGWYEVDDVAYEAGELVRLAVRFAQWCDDKDEAHGLHGELRWDASAPIPGPPTPVGPPPASFFRAPATAIPAAGARNHLYMVSDPGEFVGRGQTHVAIGGGPVHQAFGDTWLHFDDDGWTMQLRPSNRAAALEAGFYPKVGETHDNPVRGGFSLSGNGRGCNRQTSDLVVDEVDVRGGVYRDLALRFEQHCEDRVPALRGQIVWQTPVAAGALGPPTDLWAQAQGQTATLRWSPPPTVGVEEPTSYEVVAYRDGTAVGNTITLPAARFPSAEIPITPGFRWTFKVTAVNGVGPGVRSLASNAIGLPARDLGPFSSVEAFVRQQHLDFLGRAPTASELQTAVQQISTGAVTPAAFAAALRSRPEWGGVRSPVIRLYAAAFLRPVDTAGLDYWVDRRQAGTSLARVAQAFAASPELRARYGSLTNAQFVERVYLNVLGRRPDAAGLQYWTGRLDAGTSRGTVLLGFSEAPENRARRTQLVDVTLLATAMLRRAPTVDEVNVGGVVDGQALHHLTRAEYATRLALDG